MTELAQHDVERGILIGEMLSITLGPDDASTRDERVLAGDIEQGRSQIEAGNLSPFACRGDGHDARAADRHDRRGS